MTFFLTTLPLWLSAVILIVPTTLLAMAGPVIVRRYVEVDQLRTNNEVAGFKFATVGVLYAVLLAFAVVVVWEKFNQAESEVAKEAGAAATVFRLTSTPSAELPFARRQQITSRPLSQATGRPWRAARKAPCLHRGCIPGSLRWCAHDLRTREGQAAHFGRRPLTCDPDLSGHVLMSQRFSATC
jgi:hypothetical protein